jgi:hypothetical protein
MRFCPLVSAAGSPKRGAEATLKNNRATALVMLPAMCESRRPDAPLEATRRDLPQRTGLGRVMTEPIPIKDRSGLPPGGCIQLGN